MAVQNNRTEVSRGLIEIRLLCLDGIFRLPNRMLFLSTVIKYRFSYRCL